MFRKGDINLSLVYRQATYLIRQKAVIAKTSIYYIQNGVLKEEGWESCKLYLQKNIYLKNGVHNFLSSSMRKPEMTIFAGCNGAGKSTLIESFLDNKDCVINPDLFAAQLNPLNPRSVDFQAGRHAIEKLKRLISCKQSFQVETTLTGHYMLNQMKLAKEAGYSVILYYIGLQDVRLHKARVKTRVAEGGHWISNEDINRRYHTSLLNLPNAIACSDKVAIIDNSGPTYETIAEIKEGSIKYKSECLPKWLQNPFQSWLESNEQF